ncbi:MAG: hypothetical protein HQK62_07985 [Desulfamplus sp.]|nr:hypothetical protein [Desulfamplus sp.]
MKAKLLRFDIPKEKISISTNKTEVEPLKDLENVTEKILDGFLNEIDAFARATIEKSSMEQQRFLAQWEEQLIDKTFATPTSDQRFEIIERRILQITQEKIAAENKLVER